jgi:hypothetical protein
MIVKIRLNSFAVYKTEFHNGRLEEKKLKVKED